MRENRTSGSMRRGERRVMVHSANGSRTRKGGNGGAPPDLYTAALALHSTADRGSAMTSKPVAFLLADLGVTKTHSRPHVSNDNPFSESQFKTLKYPPAFP